MIQQAPVTDQRPCATPVDDDVLSPAQRIELIDLYVDAITGLLRTRPISELDKLFQSLVDLEDGKEPPAGA